MQTRHFVDLKDKRLLNRGNSILNRLFSNSIYSIRQLASSDSEAKAMYRFLQNDNVSESDIIKNMSSNCQNCVGNKSVLCIQDTSEVNLYNHRNRIKKDDYIGLNGTVGSLGFFIHPSFVLDSETLIPYGFSDVKVWNRTHEEPKKDHSHQKKLLPIEEKESYKWIESSLKTKKVLEKAKEIIIIQDREGDIYEQFCLIPDQKTHLLIRAKTNRILQGKQKLFEHLSNQTLQGTYTIELEGDKRRNIKKRTATIEVRFSKVTITGNQYTNKKLPEKITLYAIEAKEVGENIENPIHWRLLTTKKVEDLATALLCIEWYTCRWIIEEVFRILKKEGFNIEASELSKGKAIRKLTLMMLETIIKLFIMQIAYDTQEEINPRSCFSQQEIECLEIQIQQLEGKTQKLKNPYNSSDLKRYIWAIARLGGWKGYLSERKPGITTFWIGLQKFTAIMQGWILFRDVSRR
ncbi:IS4 family transposase [Flavobacterium sp.]|jgi:Transposase DNA-binding/Transposase DDE domain|uniref:IS4 family transposase n=1 Tax=Flavobacterium sp. TaxID=239 RepID=UPI00286CC0D4|nr:IS4 family transposase [Flavobacterium sp.]